MKKYTRLTEKERVLIDFYIRQRFSIRAIAAKIDRPVKTVALEVKRNGGWLRYCPELAHLKRNRSNRKGYSKIDDSPELIEYIRKKLEEGWSPEIIAGRLKKENNKITISHESIYQWIYKQQNLYQLLPRGKRKRGLKPQRCKSKIPNRISVHERPEAINNRSEIGHYEADLVFQKGNQSQNILSVIERKTRMVSLKKNNSKKSEVVINSLKAIQKEVIQTIKTVTFDNGTEFTNHSDLGVKTFFCDPGSPWQKGAVENINAMVRRYLDYRIDAQDVTQKMLDVVADKINSRPRKIFNFLSSNEVVANLYNEKLQGVTF